MISVIVPVYKVEKYLDKCIQSILNQTYRDFEIILIDDGSPDNCPRMCDTYMKKYSCIKTYHKKNGGLSDARNFGVNHANGEFITFVDSDDYVSPDYLETLNGLIKNYKCNIAVTGIDIVTECEKISKRSEQKIYVYTGIQALEKMLYQDTLDTSACAMLLPIEIAKQNPFPIGKYHEDELTTYKYYSSVNKVVVTSSKQYFYVQRSGSIMHVFGKSGLDELDAADNLVEFCRKNYPELVQAAMSKKFSDYCQVLLSSKELKKVYPEAYIRICNYLDESKYKIVKDRKCRLKNRVAALLCIINRELLFDVWNLIIR